MRRRMVHRDSWTGNIARDQQPDQDRGRTQAGCDQSRRKEGLDGRLTLQAPDRQRRASAHVAGPRELAKSTLSSHFIVSTALLPFPSLPREEELRSRRAVPSLES